MSDIQFIDVDDDDFFDAPKALRDHVKRLQEKFKEVASERDDYRGRYQQRNVNDVLADKGFKNPKRVARDLLADKVDPLNERAVTKWLEENADDYAKAVQTPESNTEPPAQEEPPATTVAPETQSGHEAIQRTTTGAPPAGHDKYEAAFQEIDPTWTKEQVREHFLKRGL